MTDKKSQRQAPGVHANTPPYTRLTLFTATALCLPMTTFPVWAGDGCTADNYTCSVGGGTHGAIEVTGGQSKTLNDGDVVHNTVTKWGNAIFVDGPLSTLHATGTDIIIDGTASSDGDLASGIRAHGGTVDIVGGSIQATGAAYTRGILGVNQSSVSTSGTDISTVGTQSDAVHAYAGADIALNGGDISTLGSNSHGLYSEKTSTVDATPSHIEANGVNISTKGSGSRGAFAEEGGTVDITGSTITTTGSAAHGVVAGLSSQVTVTDSTVSTSGSRAYGLYADPLINTGADEAPNGNTSSISATNTDVTTSSDWSFGAFSKHGGQIVLNGGSITTSGARAYGILAGDNSSVTSNTHITTTGANAHGIQAGDDGGHGSQVTLTGGTIDTSGASAYGLHSYGGNISGTTTIITRGDNSFGAFAESNSSIDLQGTSITTSGTQAYGLIANNDLGSIGGRISDTGGSIQTSGYGAVGAVASAGGSIDLTDMAIRTAGLYGYGMYAQGGSTINFNGGSIITANETGRGTQSGDGSRAYALYADGVGSTINANNLDITTLGQRAYGAYATNGSNITLANSNVSTEGFMAYGLYASGSGSTLTANQVNVTTTGQVGDAVWAYDSGVVNLNGGTFHVGGQQNPNTPHETANGLVAVGNGTINANGITVLTEGDNSVGLLAGGDVGSSQTSGNINVSGSNVGVTGLGSVAARVSYGSQLNVTDSQLVSTQGAGINLVDNASVTLTGTTIASAGETFVSNFSATPPLNRSVSQPSQTITLGAGTVATQNNGTLLRVSRADGAAGDVALTLGAGSVSQGNILDTDAHTSGGTDVTLKEGASWSGIMQGVRNFFSEQKSDVVFDDHAVIQGDLTGTGSTFTFSKTGASIGGDVSLSQGSTTTGGSIATPITVAGDLSVDQTSRLGGNWNIAGDVASSGIIAPGNSVGVVNVGGDLNLAPSSVYAVEIDSTGNADRINVSGTANLAGTVTVSPLSTPLLGTPYTILTAANGFNGTRIQSAAFNQDYAFITPTLSYDATDVQLNIERNAVAFASVAQSKNQTATANAIDRLALSSPVANALAFTTTGGARAAFDQLSGEIHSSAKTALIEDSQPVRDAIDDRVRSTFEAPADSAQGLWIQAYGARSDINGNSNVADLHHSTGGVLIGADGLLTDSIRIGVVTGYGHSTFDTNDRDASGSSDNYHFGLYGGTEWGNLAFRSGVIYTWNDIDTRRSVGLDGISDRLKGSYDGRTLQAFGEFGYKIDTAFATLEPFANLAHVNLKTDGFTEKGGATALSASKQTTDTTFSTLGLRASTDLALGDMQAKIHGKLGWRHAFDDRTPLSSNRFVGGDAFNVEGIAIAKDAAVIETGISLGLSSNTSVGLSYIGQVGSDTVQQGVNANLSVKF